MIIKGLQKTTLLDFPGRIACTVFTGGCNLRCPFCHNASLVLTPNAIPKIGEEDFIAFLNKRKGILDGVCVTGGEPLLQKDIIPFLSKIHSLGFAVKLDTNGSFPEKLKEIIDLGIVDFIAMDIKNSFSKYSVTIGTDNINDTFSQSIDIIMNSKIEYEFRTTVVKELHTKQDILDIAKRISGAQRYYLQNFKDSGDLIAPDFSAHSEQIMNEMLESIRPYVNTCGIRGI